MRQNGRASVQMQDIEVKIKRVRVVGLVRTKADIVAEQVKDVLKAKTLQEALLKSLESKQRLKDLEIFKNVSIELDAPKNGAGSHDGMEVTFHVKECRMLTSSIAANAGTQSGDASLSFTLRNLLGRAEQLKSISMTTFPYWGQAIQVHFIKPYYKDLNKRLLLTVGKTNTKHLASGFHEHVTGAQAEAQFSSFLGKHGLAVSWDWRDLGEFSATAPLSIRLDAGHSLKCAVKHTLETDERDDPVAPTSGYIARLSQELAGLGGDVFFGKVDLHLQAFRELFWNWVFSLSLWTGFLKPFSPSKVNDRFLLGGPTTLRGFGLWGIGPREQGHSLGGDVYWSSGAHFFIPLPFVPRNELTERIRMHTFLTAGNLVQYRSPFQIRDLARNIRLSCGAGLAIRLGIAQIELNYSIPLRALSTDSVSPGFQFGIGVEML